MVRSLTWGNVRIMIGTLAGGMLGFYVMHRVETSYKEKMNQRLLEYESELKKREREREAERI